MNNNILGDDNKGSIRHPLEPAPTQWCNHRCYVHKIWYNHPKEDNPLGIKCPNLCYLCRKAKQ